MIHRNTIKVPQMSGEYVHVYQPKGDVFPGPDSKNLIAGKWYSDWVPNDHMVIKGVDGRWHIFGITHPVTPPDSVHEGEWMAFHAASPACSLKDALARSPWEDLPKVLPPQDRPGEINEHHAPYIVRRNGLYFMFYGPSPIRLATSKDLFHWVPQGALFKQQGGARDPNILMHNGEYIMVYVTKDMLLARTSKDLRTWSATPKQIFKMRRPGASESPVLLAQNGLFYLFWCIWDGTQPPYDHRTYVFCSQDPFDFHQSEPIAELSAHAPEVFCDEDGDWFISSAEYPYRGVSIAPLKWLR